MSDLSQESPMWREWAESRHAVQQMREELDRLRAENAVLCQTVEDLRAIVIPAGLAQDRMREDAERYRVIRDWPNRDNLELAIVSSQKDTVYGQDLDRIVDAARGVK